MQLMSRLRVGLLLALVAGCVSQRPLGTACPCAPGWTCVVTEQRCVRGASADASSEVAAPNADAATPSGAPDATEVLPTTPGQRTEGASCDIMNDGTPRRSDNCEAGLLCVPGSCGNFCAQVCGADGECASERCKDSGVSGNKVCDLPPLDCNPIRNLGPCPGTAQGCYLSTTIVDRTTCDCPFNAVVENASCSTSRDCFPGLACVDSTGSGVDFRCRRVCSLDPATTSNPCPLASCKAILGSKKHGFCD